MTCAACLYYFFCLFALVASGGDELVDGVNMGLGSFAGLAEAAWRGFAEGAVFISLLCPLRLLQ